ncbi:hypothetical protein Leryth_022045 [Lithospermum erythrorhizon]|nr:hypothetical protein Leryth_022045 [Lithospermum erythrorhizon]
MARIKPRALLIQSKTKKGPSQLSVATIVIYSLVLVAMLFFLYASYMYWSRRSMIQMEDKFSSMENNVFISDPKISEVPKYAVIKTLKGSITVELHKEGSSLEVVADFIDSCKKGHFKGMLFNRVIKNFVIQGGAIEKAGATEDWTTRGKQYGQLGTSLKHEAFMLGTSKAKHKNGEFDIFITTAPIPDLNEKINVFGRVINGEDVVQEIEEVDTDDHYRPKTPIGIIDVALKQEV